MNERKSQDYVFKKGELQSEADAFFGKRQRTVVGGVEYRVDYKDHYELYQTYSKWSMFGHLTGLIPGEKYGKKNPKNTDSVLFKDRNYEPPAYEPPKFQ